MKIVPEAQTQALMFKKGQLDVLDMDLARERRSPSSRRTRSGRTRSSRARAWAPTT